MKTQQDYLRDIAEIRSMMEQSTKFLSLSGWAGILAGIYALAGVWIAFRFLNFSDSDWTIPATVPLGIAGSVGKLIGLALAILILAIATAVYLSYRKAGKRGETIWNATSRRLLILMAVPLVTGGLLVFILIYKGWIVLALPLTLIFYGLALYNAGSITFGEVRMLGLIEIGLGILCACFSNLALWIWAIGFGLFHIIYGIYIHYKYEQ